MIDDVTSIYEARFQPLLKVIENLLPKSLDGSDDYKPVFKCTRDEYHTYRITVFSKNCFRTYFSVNLHKWCGCCALMYMSGLTCYREEWLDNHDYIDGIKDGVIQGMLWRAFNIHRTYFSYSEEEIPYQDNFAKLLGFEDVCDPYVSIKTGNMIHTTAIEVYPEENMEEVLEQRERREEYGHGDAYEDEEY